MIPGESYALAFTFISMVTRAGRYNIVSRLKYNL